MIQPQSRGFRRARAMSWTDRLRAFEAWMEHEPMTGKQFFTLAAIAFVVASLVIYAAAFIGGM